MGCRTTHHWYRWTTRWRRSNHWDARHAIESGAELVSHDQGFGRFQGLRWSDPLT